MDSPRTREANLGRHLETNKAGAPTGPAGSAAPAAPSAPEAAPKDNKSAVQPQPPRFEFGADDDFQLAQAMNHLKGQPVIASNKSMAAQAKPQ